MRTKSGGNATPVGLLWLAVAAVGGYFLALPLSVVLLFVYDLGGIPALDDGEEFSALLIAAVVGVPVLVVVLGVAVWARRRLVGWRAGVFWVVTVVLVFLPVVVLLAGGMSVNQYLGKGWLW